jgi:hypothetical protein
MQFDARTAKQLAPDAHMTIEGCTGLRLVASTSRRSWIYRYRSPIDGRMRQAKIGEWPAMPVAAVAAEWEQLRAGRDAGNDLAPGRRCASLPNGHMVSHSASPTVREICRTYCAKILTPLDRLDEGNPGNARSVGAGVVELKINFGGVPSGLIGKGRSIGLIDRHVLHRTIGNLELYWGTWRFRWPITTDCIHYVRS